MVATRTVSGDDALNQQNGQARTRNMWAIPKWALVVLFAACSVVLLVAGKTVAGISCALSGLVLALPAQRLVARRRFVLWGRTLAVATLLAVTIQSIAGTDVKPEQRVTGNAAVDKLAAIVQGFRDSLSGENGGVSGPGDGGSGITEEAAEKLAACLRGHGLADLPDPELNEDGFSFDFSRVDASEEAVRAAQEACQHIVADTE